MLAHILAEVIAEGFPMVDVLPLFDEPDRVAVPGVDDFPADLFAVAPLTRVWLAAAEAVPLFDL